LLELTLSRELRLVVSQQLEAELASVLRHGRGLERYRDLPRVEAFIAAVHGIGEMHADLADPPAVSRDASDDYLVALALRAGAQLVSGDPDLTVPGLALMPRDFLDSLRAGG
jgi:predicted nucleic acid-binding protein